MTDEIFHYSGPRAADEIAHDRALARDAAAAKHRTTLARIILFWLAVLLALAGWLFRWQAVEMHPARASDGSALLVNRWTGEIRYIEGSTWSVVREFQQK